MSEQKPDLSVVIATLGRPLLIRTLESLLSADGFDRCEVLVIGVVPPGDTLDQLKNLIARHPRIRRLEVSFSQGDMSEKRNVGWKEARGGIVAFVDDDVVVADQWVLSILEPFARPDVGLVTGPSLVPDDLPTMPRLAGMTLASKATGYVSHRYLFASHEPLDVRWSRIIGCNMAFRKSLLELVGGFDPRYGPGDDLLAAAKLTRRGYKLVFHPRASLYHYPRSSFVRFCKQIFGYGATRVRLVRAGTEIELTTLVPGLWVLSLLVLGAGALCSKICLWLLVLDLVLYFFVDLWITLTKVAETKRKIDLLMFFLVPVLHLSYGLAEWTELFRPNKDLSEKLPSAGKPPSP